MAPVVHPLLFALDVFYFMEHKNKKLDWLLYLTLQSSSTVQQLDLTAWSSVIHFSQWKPLNAADTPTKQWFHRDSKREMEIWSQRSVSNRHLCCEPPTILWKLMTTTGTRPTFWMLFVRLVQGDAIEGGEMTGGIIQVQWLSWSYLV